VTRSPNPEVDALDGRIERGELPRMPSAFAGCPRATTSLGGSHGGPYETVARGHRSRQDGVAIEEGLLCTHIAKLAGQRLGIATW
jgi:hypothetical protein